MLDGSTARDGGGELTKVLESDGNGTGNSYISGVQVRSHC